MEHEEVMDFEMENACVGKEMSACVDFILEGEWTEVNQMAAVAFEEAFVNVCKYAYGGSTGYVRVRVKKSSSSVTVHVEDRGGIFDPTKAEICEPEPMQVGGHGIRIMRHYSDMTYERKSGENHLVLEIPKKAST